MNIRFKLTLLLIYLLSFAWSQNCCEAQDIAEQNCGGLGCYIPQCTESCQWESMQCWSSTGYCWCVDQNGVEIEGTSTPSWQGLPECEEFVLGDFNTDGSTDILDVIILVNHILSPAAVELDGADINDDGDVNILDIIQLMDMILN